jgi:hypothetical protein
MNEMGRTCGAYGGGKKGAQGVGAGNLRERGRWGDPDVDGRVILRWMFRKLEGGRGDWMELAQDRDRWRALVSMVKNLRDP